MLFWHKLCIIYVTFTKCFCVCKCFVSWTCTCSFTLFFHELFGALIVFHINLIQNTAMITSIRNVALWDITDPHEIDVQTVINLNNYFLYIESKLTTVSHQIFIQDWIIIISIMRFPNIFIWDWIPADGAFFFREPRFDTVKC